MTNFEKIGLFLLFTVVTFIGCSKKLEPTEGNYGWEKASCSINAPDGRVVETNLRLPEPLYTLSRTGTVYVNENGTINVIHENGVSVLYGSSHTVKCDNYKELL